MSHIYNHYFPSSLDEFRQQRKLRILRSLKCDEVEEPMDNESPFRGREAEIPSQQFPTINSSFY